MSADQRSREWWPVSRWSLIGRVQREGIDGARPFLTELLSIYYPAMRSFLVSKMRVPASEVEDVLQGFVQVKVLEQALVAKANPDYRFRCFVQTTLRRHVINQYRERMAAKRHLSGAQIFPLYEDTESVEYDDMAPQFFDVEWARAMLNDVLRRMQEECEAAGKGSVWAVWEHRVLKPLLEKLEPLPYLDLVERYGFLSEAQATNTLETAKRIFRRTLQSVVGKYVQDEAEIEEEIRYLIEVLAKWGAR